MEKVSFTAVSPNSPRRPDYSRWTVEELRRFAHQLRVRGADTKSRRELVELFDVSVAHPLVSRRVQTRERAGQAWERP
jgi:hypothetical protein